MKDFVFSNTTKVYFGKDQLHHLSEEIAKFGKKVLLVYGGGQQGCCALQKGRH